MPLNLRCVFSKPLCLSGGVDSVKLGAHPPLIFSPSQLCASVLFPAVWVWLLLLAPRESSTNSELYSFSDCWRKGCERKERLKIQYINGLHFNIL